MHIAQFEPLGFCNAPTFKMHRDHPYIYVGGLVCAVWVRKIAFFVDLQYSIYAYVL